MSAGAHRVIGTSPRRNEDARLLTGRALFVDDVQLPGMLHVAFARSSHAHGRLGAVDTSRALRRPGVVAAFTAADLGDYWQPGPLLVPPPPIPGLVFHECTQVPLAKDKVRHAGEPLALIVATSRYVAEDAAGDVAVELAPLPAVTDLEAALRPGAPLVHEHLGANVAAHVHQAKGDYAAAKRGAHLVVSRRFHYDRGAAAAIENRGIVASWDRAAEELTVWDTTQAPIPIRNGLAAMLGLAESQVRVIAPFIGGGFGPKIMMYYPEEVLLAWAALRLGRPLKWIEDRQENFYATTQERAQVHDAELAVAKDGRIIGVKDVFLHDTGAYDPYGLTIPINSQCTLLGPYDVPHYDTTFTAVFTNRTLCTPVRGAGRQHGVFVMERLLDLAARQLGLDRVEIRRRNLLPKSAFPHDHKIIFQDFQPLVYDSGDYAPALAKAAEMIGYERFVKEEQPRARAQGRRLGIGLVSYIEGTGIGPYEGARVTVEPSGDVRVVTGVGTQGQGHFTSFAQIVAEALGTALERVHVTTGDTRAFNWGTGTFASRGAVVAGSACWEAAQRVRAKAVRLASEHLGAHADQIELVGGTARVRGDAGRSVPLGELAARANPLRGAVKPGSEPGLEATAYFGPSRGSTANGVHAMTVEVDPETAQVTILRYVVVHDSGVVLNPTIVEGQIQGGVAHGIGNAFYEQLVVDDSGQLMNASFMDYLLPTALDVPTVEMAHLETPSPLNPLGTKGVGEAGCIPTGALFAQAVEDALAPDGVEILEIPLSPSRLYEIITQATAGDRRRPEATGARPEGGPAVPAAAPRAGRALVIDGEFVFDSPREAVYRFLLDPDVLARVMPGAQRLLRVAQGRYEGMLKVGIGFLSAAEFSLVVGISGERENHGYLMHVDSRGTLGFVSGTAEVLLVDDPKGSGTVMRYRAEMSVGGTLAAVGQRLLESGSKIMSKQGLKALNKEMLARRGTR